METKSAVRMLAALAQETRLAVFRQLVEAGPAGRAAGELAEALGCAPATLSFHLKELSNAALIEGRQDGRFVIYAANFAAMNGLLGYLTENCCRGRQWPSAAGRRTVSRRLPYPPQKRNTPPAC
ncbi:ArsR/SmtB family transcription factor [Vogesella fluminis]|uniref:ArsR/SmtB family transcription factor n=1 Tax=Vogesella fluminis TaxID=1069161 RepID=UPI00363DFADB